MSGALPGARTDTAGQAIPLVSRLAEPPEPPVRPPEPAPKLFPVTQEDMLAELDRIGVGKSARVRKEVRAGNISTPESFIAALGKGRVNDPAVRQRRDARIAEIREAVRKSEADPVVDRVVSKIDEVRQHAAAMQRLSTWFDANASEDLKLSNQMLPGDRETADLLARDVRAVVALVETTKDKGDLTPEVAAFRYFGRTPDPGYALNMIAHDAAQARGEKGNRAPKYYTKGYLLGGNVDAQTESDRATLALLSGQGWDTGQKAATWVEKNMSPETYALLMSMQTRSASTKQAGYRWIDYGARSQGRDDIRGLTEAGRVGPARAVSEPTEEQVEARAKKVQQDREALETEARIYLAFTPEQWDAMTPQTRQEHVLDYLDLRDLRRTEPGPLVAPDAPIAQAAPIRKRAVPSRQLTPAEEAIERLREELIDAASQTDGPSEVSFRVLAGQTQWPADAHPRVTALLRAGDVAGALRTLAATAPNRDLRALAGKLAARIGDARSQVVPAEVMENIRATLSPEVPSLGVETPAGVYVHPRSAAAIDAMRREGHTNAADLVEQYGGQMLFNEDAPLSPELAMHEAVHRVADQVLMNKSHPLTRQLDALRTNLLKFVPVTEYGMSNVREFLAEGLTNPAFRRTLSYATAEGKPYSAWKQFKTILRNWLRGMLGQPALKPDTALTAVDHALDAVLASNPNEMMAGDIVGASFSPGGARAVLRDAVSRARVPTKRDIDQIQRVMRDVRIPTPWKTAFMKLAVPLEYVASAAEKYMPSARRVHDIMVQHQAEIQRVNSIVGQTTEKIAKDLSKHRANQTVVDNFNRVLFQGTLIEVDARKPRSTYEGYSFRYDKVDSDGNVIGTVESQRFKTEAERDKAMSAYNRALPVNAPAKARARRGFSENAEQLRDFDRLKALYNTLPTEVKGAVSRAFDMPVILGKELQSAIQTRLNALLPHPEQKALQDKVYGIVYQKILAGQLIDPYQPLRREGEFWLSYEAVDPELGGTELFKHSFHTEAQRDAAIRMLLAAPADQQIRNIEPYQNVGSAKARARVPMEFVARVLDSIDASDTMDGSVKAQVLELMFDTLPETSFVNSFRRRANVRGFVADFTPITEGLTAGDTIKNLRESSLRIGRQAADLRYGAEFSAVRTALEKEFNEFQATGANGSAPQERARQIAAAQQYHDLLVDYTAVPFRKRGRLSRMLTGATYFLTLGFNVSTAMVTFSQIPLFVAPFLSGKYGAQRTVSAIGEASRTLTNSGRTRTVARVGENGQIEEVRVPVHIWDFSVDNYDMADQKNAYLAPLQDIGKKNGVFNRSLLQDELLGEQATIVERVSAASGILQHHAERYSRETALLSTYFLELQDAMGQQKMPVGEFVAQLKDGRLRPTPEQARDAALQAVSVSERTNGPIYAAAAPLASQNDIGSVAYLFKRHPLSMMNLLANTMMRANPLGTNTPADRRIAQLQLSGMMGMMGLMSGVLGMPLMQQIGWLYDLLIADEDEPDFESMVRISLGESGAFGLVDYVTGLRVSERIGLSDAIYRPGFSTEDLPVPYQILEGIGGPVVGMVLKPFRAPPERLAESLLPSAIANVIRGIRFGTEGARTLRGDPILEDVGPFHAAARAIGFTPAEYSQRLAMNSLGSRINNAINERRSRLLQQRYVAFREGDTERVREIDTEIREFNRQHPYNPITAETVRESLQSHIRTTSQMSYGLSVSPRNQAYIRELMEQFGPANL